MAEWIAEQSLPNVTLLGQLDREGVRREMLRAAFLVSPSVCYEMFPVTIAEAYGCSLPVIASRLGGVSSLVEDGVTGLLFNPGDIIDLKKRIDWSVGHFGEMLDMGRMARACYERAFTPDANLRSLIQIYDAAVRNFATRATPARRIETII
jgi:glycosyltransferase involved in cell wall biosynthesis